MILFVGNRVKGFFCEEAAQLKGMDFEYISADLHISNQAQEILRYKEQAGAAVYDLEQYADESEEIVDWILRIQDAIGVKTIIYAAGYSPGSTVIRLLYESGIKNFIFSIYLGEKKEDLELCLNGYYENFGYEEKRGISFAEKEPEEPGSEKEKTKAVCIGVAGAITRMGTTTQALQLVKFFQFFGYRAAYIQMNRHHYVEDLKEAYEQVEHDEETGRATYLRVDMYYRMDRLQDVLKMDYDYLVFDYGVYSENGFNKISFLEKEIQIFVVGSKPGGEFEKTYDVIKNNFYNQVFYIFNFVAKTEQADLLELMEEKAGMTFFAGEARDPFSFAGEGSIYEKIISLERKETPDRKRKWFGRRNAR